MSRLDKTTELERLINFLEHSCPGDGLWLENFIRVKDAVIKRQDETIDELCRILAEYTMDGEILESLLNQE